MGTNTPKKNRTDQTAADQRMIDALTKHAATITSMVIGGVVVSSKDIIGEVQARVAASQNATAGRATWQALVVAETNQHAQSKAFMSSLRQTVLAAFSGQVDVLADFGLTPRKARVQTPEQLLVATAKAKATRAARHTMGKVQKAKITGDNPTGAPAGSPPGTPLSRG